MPHPNLVLGRPVPPSFFKVIRRAGSTVGVLILIYVLIWLIFLALNPNGPDPVKQKETELWIATSHSWLDRVSCRWLGICGGSNWLISTWLFRRKPRPRPRKDTHNHRHEWIDGSVDPGEWSEEERRSRTVPDYVFEHAPFLYLHEDEQWWPTDVADFLHHVQHRQEGQSQPGNVRLSTMTTYLPRDQTPGGTFLQSLDDPEELPDWITSAQNRPVKKVKQNGGGERPSAHATEPKSHGLGSGEQSKKRKHRWQDYILNPAGHQKVLSKHIDRADLEGEFGRIGDSPSPGGRSPAPAFLITVEKANNTLDAFWFFFYAFNRGARVTGIQYGNHVGDWEHVMVRFQDRKPTGVFLSAHEWGSAYDFDVMEKLDSKSQRPVAYAGLGSHAHYATPGKHAYALPFALLSDSCSQGYLWDPLLNLISYVHEPSAKGWPEQPKFKASMSNPRVHSSWLEYQGRWGDKRFTLGDAKGRNYRFAGELKYLSGPTGPWDKSLDRKIICEHKNKPCELRDRRDGYVGPIKGTTEIESFGS